jgi:hypothetical protein
MASKSITLSESVAVRRPLLDKIFGWLTTIDHKRLGILHILFALAFLATGGIEATIMRCQLSGHLTVWSRRNCSTGCSRCMEPGWKPYA